MRGEANSIFKILLLTLLVGLFQGQALGQTCTDCGATINNQNITTPYTFGAGLTTCVTGTSTLSGDLTFGADGVLCVSTGSTLNIQSNNYFADANDAFTINVYGTLNFERNTTLSSKITINIFSTGTVTTTTELKLNGSIMNITNRGVFNPHTLTFNNSSAVITIENFASMTVYETLNISAGTAQFKNNNGGNLTIIGNYNSSPTSVYINCGTYDGKFNLNGGGKVINAGTGKFTTGQIDYGGSSSRFENFGILNVVKNIYNSGLINLSGGGDFYNEGLVASSTSNIFQSDGNLIGPSYGSGKGYFVWSGKSALNNGNIGPNLNFRNTSGESSKDAMFPSSTGLHIDGSVTWGLGNPSLPLPVTDCPMPDGKPSTPVPTSTTACTGVNLITLQPATGGVFYEWWTGEFESNKGSQITDPLLTNYTTAGIVYLYAKSVSYGVYCAKGAKVTISGLPSTPTAGNSGPVCIGGTLSLSASDITNANYEWTKPDGTKIKEQNPVVSTFATSAIAGTYTVVATVGTCPSDPVSTTVIVNPTNTVTAGTTTSVCEGSNLPDITHTTTGATGINTTTTGLPDGVTAAWESNIITISGTPTASGTFSYSIPLTGGCGTVSATGTITVTPNNTVTAASSSPILCINTALTAITHTTTGATGIGTATGLPAGVTASWASDKITISGTPTASGTFNYSIPLTGGCGTVNATGTINVTSNNTVGLASTTPTICINNPLTPITHLTTGATGIGTPIGLPAGVTASFGSNTITISGTPTKSGTFNYNIPLTGGCGTVDATGTINVTSNNTVTAASSSPTLCINTALTEITHTTTGATGIGTANGLPDGVTAAWASNTITISGTPTASGTFNYSIPLTGGCGTVSATGTITVTPNNTVGNASSTPTICINNSLTPITHSTTVATGIGPATGLPAGVTASWASNTITISGIPTEHGTFDYNIPLSGGCETISATGRIIVKPLPATPTISSNGPLCKGASLDLSALEITDATYLWSGPNGFTSTDRTPSISNVTTAMSGTYTVTATVNGCSSSASAVITVNPTINILVSSSISTTCPDLTHGFNSDDSSYKLGATEVIFRVSGPDTDSDWSFYYTLSIDNSEINESSPVTGTTGTITHANNSTNYEEFVFWINNSSNVPSIEVEFSVSVVGYVDGSCSETDSSDNSTSATIYKMPNVGPFNPK